MRKVTVTLVFVLVCLAVFAGQTAAAFATGGSPSAQPMVASEGASVVPGRVIVKIDPKAAAIAAVGPQPGVGIASSVESIVTQTDVFKVVSLKPGTTIADAIATYSKAPGVDYVQPDFVYRVSATTPDDPMLGQLWGLHNAGQDGGTAGADISAPGAWDYSTGSRSAEGPIVAVVDTGVDYNHPDLAANMWANPGEIPGNGIDDDGNGYVDDVHGYDFVNNDGDPMDDHSHGTHCSGTIGAVGDNGVGVVGVNWAVRIMALKFLGAGGSGSTSDAMRAIDYANRTGADVISNSWGGGGFDQSLKDVIDASRAVVVCAAGNAGSNNDVGPFYPSSYESTQIISVAATDRNDRLAGFSCYGATSVDVAAPGVDIFSTVPAAVNGGSLYRYMSGTSMATPHVAGLAALIKSRHPELSNSDIKSVIQRSVDLLPATAGKCATGGRIDAAAAMQLADNVPSLSSIQGRVTDTHGDPVAGALVRIHPSGSPDLWRTFTSRPDGSYDASELAGGDYKIEFSGRRGASSTYWRGSSDWSGATVISLASGVTTTGIDGVIARPANDDFENAQPISGQSGTVSGTNVDASIQPGEAYGRSASVWYRWTAPSDGVLDLDTRGSSFDTWLTVTTGDTLVSQVFVASNDDFYGVQSRVVFPVHSGTTYNLSVDGFSAASQGSLVLNWQRAVPHLTASPSAYHFGTLRVGDSAATTLTIVNTGGQAATISDLGLSQPAAGMSLPETPALPATLGPGQSFAVGVTYAPVAVGSLSTSLTVTSDADNSPTEVGLKGAAAVDTVVTFPDANLEAAVRSALGQPTGDITNFDMVRLTSLSASYSGISSLEGLQYATNLGYLYLYGNQISDISALSGLDNLQSLFLGGNQISDISPVSGLASLQYLDLFNNRVSDISAVSGLTTLTGLYMSYNQISDISAVAGLANLQSLYLDSNRISDISALSGLDNLQSLYLGGNQISDISPVSGLSSLQSLYLYGNQVSDISTLPGLLNLSYVDVRYNRMDTRLGMPAMDVINTLTGRGVSVWYLPQRTSLSGSVVDSRSSGSLSGIYVTAQRHDPQTGDWYWEGGQYSSDVGTFSFAQLPEGDYRLYFQDWRYWSYPAQYYDRALDESSATTVTLVPGQDLTGVVEHMVSYPSISGRVTDSVTGREIQSANVELLRRDSSSGNWYYSNRNSTDSHGEYRFASLSEGDYRVRFTDDNGRYVPQYFDGVTNESDAATVAVAMGQSRSGVDARMQPVPGGRIEGTVTGPDGSPVSGVQATVYRRTQWGWSWTRAAWTDSDGAYSAFGLAAGDYRVGFQDGRGFYLPIYYSAATSLETAQDVAVTQNAITSGIDVRMRDAAFISGRVTDGTNPISSIQVTAYSRAGDSWTEVGSAWTGGDGSYRLGGIASGTYRVGFADTRSYYGGQPQWGSQFYDKVTSLDAATDVGAKEGTTTPDIDAVLKRFGHMTGTVRASGNPVQGVRVAAFTDRERLPFESTYWDWWYSSGRYAYTDADGRYDIPCIDAKDYRVQFWDPSGRFITQYYDRVSGVASATAVSGSLESTVTDVDADLLEFGKISGSVTCGSAPLAGATIDLYRLSGSGRHTYWYLERQASTDSTGSYVASGLRDGRYRVGFSDPQGRALPSFFESATTLADATDITVGAGHTATGISADLRAAGHVVGMARDTSGKPAAGVTVMAQRWIGTRRGWVSVRSASTGSDGSYDIGGLDSGVFKILFVDYQGRFASQYYDNAAAITDSANVTVTAGATTSGIDATMLRMGHVAGVVTANGEPVPQALVYAWGSHRGYWTPRAGAWTSASGYYDMGSLAEGEYRIGFRAPDASLADVYYQDAGSVQAGTNVPVHVEQTTRVDQTLTSSAHLGGTVRDSQGQPIRGVSTSLLRREADGGWYLTGRRSSTDAEGNWTSGPVLAGDYKVEFWDGNHHYAPQWFNAVKLQSDATTVTSAAGQVVGSIDATMLPFARITGRATYKGVGVSKIAVTAYQARHHVWQWAGSVSTNREGYYDIGRLNEGTYRLEFTDTMPRYLRQYYSSSETIEGGTDVVVTDGSVTTSIDASLVAGGHITGTIGGLRDVSGIAVAAMAPDGEGWRTVGRARSTASGYYDLGGLETGDYRIRYSDDYRVKRFATQFYDRARNVQTAQDVSTARETVRSGVDTVLLATGHIDGVATDSGTGEPVPSVTVTAYRKHGVAWEWARGGSTSASGYYDFGGLPSGDWRVGFTDGQRRYLPQFFDGSDTLIGARDVTVNGDATASGVDAHLRRAGQIGGVVTDTSGTPVPNVRVVIRSADWLAGGDPWRTTASGYAFTDASGYYSLGGLPANDYVAYFVDPKRQHAPQYYRAAANPVLSQRIAVAEGGVVGDVDATLTPGASLYGRVVDTAGNAIDGVSVTLTPFGESASGYVARSTNGYYEAMGIPTGRYRVGFWDRRGRYLHQYFDAAADGESARQLELVDGFATGSIDATLQAAASISGRVTAAGTGSPLSSVAVTVLRHDDDGTWTWTTQRYTGRDGSYRVSNLLAGHFAVYFSARHGEYAGQYYRGAARLADATIINLAADQSASDVDAVLGNESAIAGRVVDGIGTGIAGVNVTAVLQDGFGASSGYAYTDASGYYRVGRLGAGDYKVLFADRDARPHHRTFAPVFYGGAYDARDASVVPVAEGVLTPSIDVTLSAGGSLSGQLSYSNGAEVDPTAFLVRVERSEDETCTWASPNRSTVRSGVRGRYVLTGLAPGDYTVMYHSASGYADTGSWGSASGYAGWGAASGYAPAIPDQYYLRSPSPLTANKVHVDENGSVVDIDDTVSGTGWVRGRLRTTDGKFVLGQRHVTLWSPGTGAGWVPVYETVTDVLGLFAKPVLPGRYILSFSDTKGLEGFFAGAGGPLATSSDQAVELLVGEGQVEFVDASAIVSDTTPPVTTISGVSPDWSSTDVTFSLAATDSGSGVAAIHYSLAGATAKAQTVAAFGPGPATLGPVSSEGVTTVFYWSEDSAVPPNTEAPAKTATIRIDKTKPSTTSNARASYVGAAMIDLTPTDALSGAVSTWYRLDSVSGTGARVTTNATGSHHLEFGSIDAAGNREDTKTVDFTVVAPDRTAPVSSISGVPSDWSKADVSFSLSAVDTVSGVAAIHYSLSGATTRPDTVAVAGPGPATVGPVTEEGTTTVTYWAVDRATPANIELPAKTATIRIDKTPPATNADAKASYVGTATITLTPADALSGVALTTWKLDQTGGTGAVVVAATPGTHTVEYASVDTAGNRESTKTATFKVVAADTAPPVSTISGLTDAWSSRDATFSLVATDPGSGVAAIHYALAGAATKADTVAVAGPGPVTVGPVTAEGTTTVSYWAVDKATPANTETSRTATIRIDKTAPKTSSDATGSYVTTAAIILTPTDSLSGVASTWYVLDTVSGTDRKVTTTTPGVHTLKFGSTDAAGNREATQTVTFTVTMPKPADVSPPVTTISGIPAGWARADVIVSLTATDNGGDGVAATYIDLGSGVATYSAPVTLTAEGTTTVSYFSADGAIPANVEVTKTAQVRIDRQAPVTTSDVLASYVGTATIALDPTDAVSGVASTSWRLDGTPGTGSLVATTSIGTHTLDFASTDVAGNREDTQTVTFTIAAPAPELRPTSISLASSTGHAYNLAPFTLSGRLVPGGKNDRLVLRYRMSTRGPWTQAAVMRARRGGYWAFTFVPTRYGTYYIHVDFDGDATRAASSSRTIAVKSSARARRR